jgi:toxin ParE1/3/4
MSLILEISPRANRDLAGQYRWYFREAGSDVAQGYLEAFYETAERLAEFPGLGRERKFEKPSLRHLRSLGIEAPYDAYAIYYRTTSSHLVVERVMHGARDLPRHLGEQPAVYGAAAASTLALSP